MRRVVVALGLTAFLLAFVCSPAGAQGSGSANWVGVAQTVFVSTTSTGKVSGTPEVASQFSANGSCPVTLKVPMSANGFRNLSGLGEPPIKGGYAVWNLHLDGPTNQRSVAHFPTAKLPLQISAAYELNGKKVKAKDIVGKTGELKVSYEIANVTTEATKVTFTNLLGKKETTTVKAPVPYAAIVDVTLPANFTNLKGSAGVTASGNGNGTSTASWTLFLFNPLGGVKQTVTYQAHVTNAVVPSATVEAAPLPPFAVKPLPPISEPGPPAVPTVTLGHNLAALQLSLHTGSAKLAAKASAALSSFKKVAVPAVKGVSGNAATVAGELPAASAAAKAASTNAANTSANLAQASGQAADTATRAADVRVRLKEASADAAAASARVTDVHSRLSRAAAEANDSAKRIANVRTSLKALPPAVHLTPAYRALHAKLVKVEARLKRHALRLQAAARRAQVASVRLGAHAARLRVTAANAGVLAVRHAVLSDRLARASSAAANVLAPAAAIASTKLAGLVPTATALSTDAAAAATTISNATLSPRQRASKPVQPTQVGGGAQLDQAVGQLDAAITSAANNVDSSYAYITALDQRATNNRLPAGNAIGATAQAGAFVYSVSGANDTAHETKLATFIGGFALFLGLAFGIGLYRIRRGLPSSLAPPKSSASAAGK